MLSKASRIYICKSDDLGEKEHITRDVIYSGEPQSSLFFRFNQKVYAYVNRCVHMPRKLNCERDIVFDDTGKYLRCSMHGIVYDPESGASLSTMCNGERLQAIKIVEDNGCVYINDKRVLMP